MILERGDMWSVFGKTDLFLITTNPIVRKDGGAVMGRGIAKEAATRFPSLPFDFGTELKLWNMRAFIPPVGELGNYDGQVVGWFMVKDHWATPAKVAIIKESVEALVVDVAPYFKRIDLNFPGIGNGKLKREDVLPIIERLPDNVHVWEYK